jgi:Flp pilus assembly protein TadG
VRLRGQAGSATVELVLLTPLLVALLLFVVTLGRLALSRAEVNGAARDGARAASLAPDAGAAPGLADAAARSTLAARHVTCSSLSVATDTGSFGPGGQVRVTVACGVYLGDLTPLVGGTRTIRADFVEVTDAFRSYR